jgi:hypothetical protein
MDDQSITRMTSEDLRGTVLRQPLLSSSRVLPLASFQKRDVIYLLPPGAKDNHRAAFLAQLIIRGRSPSLVAAEWRSWVLTIVAAGFQDMITAIIDQQPTLYEKRVIDPVHLTPLQEMHEGIVGWGMVEPTDAVENQTALDAILPCMIPLSELPDYDSSEVKRDLARCVSIEALYGYLALVLVLAAKSINDANRVAITINRPRNIEQKYRIVDCPCLTGDLRISDNGHSMINAAFVSMDHFRGALFTRLADVKNAASDRGTAVVMTLVRLLDWTGMTYVPMIDRFLTSHSNIEGYGFLMPSYQSFIASLRALAKVPPHIRPFYKLIHGDTTKMFNRRDVEELMVCAIRDEARDRPSLMQYGLPPTSDQIWETYKTTRKTLKEMDDDVVA